MNQRRRMTSAEAVVLLHSMRSTPLTREEMIRDTGHSRHVIHTWVKEMHDAQLIYVSDWVADSRGRLFVPTFRAMVNGGEVDAPRPGQRRSAAERMAALRAARRGQG